MTTSPRWIFSIACLGLVLVAARPSPQPGHIEGMVTDETGVALVGANVHIAGTALGVATDTDGRFRLADVEAGEVELRTTFVGYEPKTIQVSVRDGGTATVEIQLTADSAVLDEVTVTYERPIRSRGESGRAVTGEGLSVRSGSRASESPPPAAAPAADRARDGSDSDASGGLVRPSRPGLLTAGDIDDALNWPDYLGYVRRTLDSQRPQRRPHRNRQQDGQSFPDLNLDDRVMLRVVDQAGHPVAGARVSIEATGGSRARRLVTEAGTDGRLALFPRFDFGVGTRRLAVRVQAPGGVGRAVTETIRVDRVTGDRSVRVQLPITVAQRPREMDLAFVIDVTGSMADELRYLTEEFEAIVARVEQSYPGVDLRFGLVAYRDQGDAFVVRRWDFTRSAGEMQQHLASLDANGGGDYPEAMDQALETALDLDWRTGTAARIAFLVADAPPHDEGVDRTIAAIRQARARGLRLYPLAASGVADQAEYLMRAAAVLTQARHLFLTDDSGVGNAHAEPKIACYQVTALDNLLVRVIASELEGRRVEPAREDVIREVGDYDTGVCETRAVVQRPQTRRQRSDGLGYVED